MGVTNTGGQLLVLFGAEEHLLRLGENQNHPVGAQLKRFLKGYRITQCAVIISGAPNGIRLADKGDCRGCFLIFRNRLIDLKQRKLFPRDQQGAAADSPVAIDDPCLFQ